MSIQKKNYHRSLKTTQNKSGGGGLVGRSMSTRSKPSNENSIFEGEIYVDENVSKIASADSIRKSARNLKHALPAEKSSSSPKPKGVTVGIQVSLSNTITEALLTCPDIAADNHWQPLAEKRLKIIETLLEEKYQLQKENEELKKNLAEKEQMLEEANSLVEVITDLANHTENDDTGIDVGEISNLENGDSSFTQD